MCLGAFPPPRCQSRALRGNSVGSLCYSQPCQGNSEQLSLARGTSWFAPHLDCSVPLASWSELCHSLSYFTELNGFVGYKSIAWYHCARAGVWRRHCSWMHRGYVFYCSEWCRACLLPSHLWGLDTDLCHESVGHPSEQTNISREQECLIWGNWGCTIPEDLNLHPLGGLNSHRCPRYWVKTRMQWTGKGCNRHKLQDEKLQWDTVSQEQCEQILAQGARRGRGFQSPRLWQKWLWVQSLCVFGRAFMQIVQT